MEAKAGRKRGWGALQGAPWSRETHVRILWFEAGRARDAFLYGASAGLLLGLMSWAVNYWSLTAMQGGLLLLVVFYGLVGLIQQSVVGRFSRQAVLEYGIVLLIGLLIVILGPG